MNLPEDILKQVNSLNWSELWDESMITKGKSGKEYVWDVDTTKQFIKNLVAEVRRETIEKIKEGIKHEQQKMLDGFSHPKDCEMCKANLLKGD
jgi:hypothetical protein